VGFSILSDEIAENWRHTGSDLDSRSHSTELKGGEETMEATFCETKNGNGYKICVDDEWIYTSKAFLLKVIAGVESSCKFRSIEDREE